ncbi:hypothetical protein AAHB50_30750 [Bacillus toyonensis]
MSIQYPYNNYYQTPQIPNYLTAQNQFDINTNNAPVYDNRQDCLPERPPKNHQKDLDGYQFILIFIGMVINGIV